MHGNPFSFEKNNQNFFLNLQRNNLENPHEEKS
jgi:hypothetical protein